MPAIASSAVIAFLASFENYNTTVFSILSDQTLTTVIASKVRLGISPAISALALVIITLTLDPMRLILYQQQTLASLVHLYSELLVLMSKPFLQHLGDQQLWSTGRRLLSVHSQMRTRDS